METLLHLVSLTASKLLHFSGLSDDRKALKTTKMEEKALEVYELVEVRDLGDEEFSSSSSSPPRPSLLPGHAHRSVLTGEAREVSTFQTTGDLHLRGTHSTEEDINKQINDKERVAAAMENPNLREIVEQCVTEPDD
ncbi:hypothetical protein F7725_023461 [Dissostichus mawsoni]|uniref:Cytosolic iron-sulfur assembly component 2A n=1 Tax=Dissostichus mawsoni TaxID=36200 RepID=A0A7J5Z187_DISMA|nr:hypothetical protein F7725_023461 [Dissostichus mawsoni]